MKLNPLPPAKSLNKAYLKQSPKREQVELFKSNLARLFDRVNEKESEENLKNIANLVPVYTLPKNVYTVAHEIQKSSKITQLKLVCEKRHRKSTHAK